MTGKQETALRQIELNHQFNRACNAGIGIVRTFLFIPPETRPGEGSAPVVPVLKKLLWRTGRGAVEFTPEG
jgi:hypothetical protein